MCFLRFDFSISTLKCNIPCSGGNSAIEISFCSFYFGTQLRAEHVVPRRMVQMEEAIMKKDFDKFADLTMKVGPCVFLYRGFYLIFKCCSLL